MGQFRNSTKQELPGTQIWEHILEIETQEQKRSACVSAQHGSLT